jgi:glycosyltransferase involved in cell wall biosynthesis
LDTLVSLTERDVTKWKTMNSKIGVIPNAVSFLPEKPAQLENKVILWIGRIDKPKGYDLLLDVFKIFSAREKEWRLRIIGEGAGKNDLIKRLQESDLMDRVEVLSATDRIEAEYQKASVSLMTSRTEGFPMVLLEAQASGLPVMAFDVETGPSEIIHHGVDGFLVGPNDKDKMAQYLLQLCLDIDQRRSFGQNGRINAENYLPERIGRLWENLFQELQN